MGFAFDGFCGVVIVIVAVIMGTGAGCRCQGQQDPRRSRMERAVFAPRGALNKEGTRVPGGCKMTPGFAFDLVLWILLCNLGDRDMA